MATSNGGNEAKLSNQDRIGRMPDEQRCKPQQASGSNPILKLPPSAYTSVRFYSRVSLERRVFPLLYATWPPLSDSSLRGLGLCSASRHCSPLATHMRWKDYIKAIMLERVARSPQSSCRPTLCCSLRTAYLHALQIARAKKCSLQDVAKLQIHRTDLFHKVWDEVDRSIKDGPLDPVDDRGHILFKAGKNLTPRFKVGLDSSSFSAVFSMHASCLPCGNAAR